MRKQQPKHWPLPSRSHFFLKVKPSFPRVPSPLMSQPQASSRKGLCHGAEERDRHSDLLYHFIWEASHLHLLRICGLSTQQYMGFKTGEMKPVHEKVNKFIQCTIYMGHKSCTRHRVHTYELLSPWSKAQDNH